LVYVVDLEEVPIYFWNLRIAVAIAMRGFYSNRITVELFLDGKSSVMGK
jgi:hypothetical protein